MANSVRDSFLDLERHRRLLEESIEKLRKSLQHWQTLDAEYEGLKEEILATKPEANFQRLITIGREFGGRLVKQDEVDDLLGIKSGKLRTSSQVTDILSKRMEYTQQNVKTLEKQLLAAENKLAAAIVISTPDVMNEDGLPLTEIREELDVNGDVISSRISTPGSCKAQLLEVLEKAGVEDLKDALPQLPHTTSPETEAPKVKPTFEEIQERPSSANTTKKAVKFADDIKVKIYERDSRPNCKENDTTKKTVGVTAVEKTKTDCRKQSSLRAEEIQKLTDLVEEQNRPLSSDVILPEDESEEDAALRQEMLKYGMSELGEVGAIVAELNLEEDDAGLTDDDDTDEFDDEDEDSDEDRFGRNTRRIVSDKVHRRMKELEERLAARMMENVGPDGGIIGAAAGVTSVTTKSVSGKSGAKETNGVEKEARFSDKLDILSPPCEVSAKSSIGDVVERDSAPVANPQAPFPIKKVLPSTANSSDSKAYKSPMGNIVERVSAPVAKPPQAPTPIKKVSRFKSARTAQSPPSTAPTPPTFAPNPHSASSAPPTRPSTTLKTSSILSDVIEHPPSADQAPEPDALDEALLRREAAVRYHEMTNRMIQRQEGGFLGDGDEVYELDEDGGPKVPLDGDGGGGQVSRFMAARVARI